MKEKLLANIQIDARKSNYKITLPQKILLNTLYSTNVISFNKKKPIIEINNFDNQLTKLSYQDHGVRIYDEQNNLISSSDDTLLDVKKLENQDIWNINFSSKGQQINKKIADNDDHTNKIFNVKLNANYKDLSKEKNGFYKQLVIAELAILFPKTKINLNADIIQDAQNFVPYGNMDLSIQNYKFIINSFYDNIDNGMIDNNVPELFTNLINNSEDFKFKTISFLEKINNNDGDNLKLQINRKIGDLPYINNLSINEISEIFNKIYNNIKNPQEGVY